MAAIPTIYKGDDSGPITLTLATGRTYTGATLIIAYQGVTRTFTNLVAGGNVSFSFTHDETRTFALGGHPILMRLVGQFGAEETVENGEARIKVTDCLGEVNAGGSFIVKPGQQGGAETKVPITDVGDMPSSYTMAQLTAKVNQIIHVLAQRSLLAFGVAFGGVSLLAASAFGAVDVQQARLDTLRNDALVVTNVVGAGAGGADTNAVNDLIRSYDATNIAARIDAKRDATNGAFTTSISVPSGKNITIGGVSVMKSNDGIAWSRLYNTPEFRPFATNGLGKVQEGDIADGVIPSIDRFDDRYLESHRIHGDTNSLPTIGWCNGDHDLYIGANFNVLVDEGAIVSSNDDENVFSWVKQDTEFGRTNLNQFVRDGVTAQVNALYPNYERRILANVTNATYTATYSFSGAAYKPSVAYAVEVFHYTEEGVDEWYYNLKTNGVWASRILRGTPTTNVLNFAECDLEEYKIDIIATPQNTKRNVHGFAYFDNIAPWAVAGKPYPEGGGGTRDWNAITNKPSFTAIATNGAAVVALTNAAIASAVGIASGASVTNAGAVAYAEGRYAKSSDVYPKASVYTKSETDGKYLPMDNPSYSGLNPISKIRWISEGLMFKTPAGDDIIKIGDDGVFKHNFKTDWSWIRKADNKTIQSDISIKRDHGDFILSNGEKSLGQWSAMFVDSYTGVPIPDFDGVKLTSMEFSEDENGTWTFDVSSTPSEWHMLQNYVSNKSKNDTVVEFPYAFDDDMATRMCKVIATREAFATNGEHLASGEWVNRKLSAKADSLSVYTKGETDARAGVVATNTFAALAIPATNDVFSLAKNYTSNSVANVQSIVQTWESFLDGSNVVFSITNYISGTYSLDTAKLRIMELRNGTNYVEVYNSRDEIAMHVNAFKTNDFRIATNSVVTSVNSQIAQKADRAWGKYTSTGEYIQDVGYSNTVYITEPQTVFAGGTEYARFAVGEGSICVLTAKGAAAYTSGDEGTFKFQDAGGTNYFGFARTDSYAIGADASGITVLNNVVTITYDITTSVKPCIWYKEDLTSTAPWEQLNLPDGTQVPGASHYVSWEQNPPAGKQVCAINCQETKGFFRASIEVAGTAKFITNMPADLQAGIICTNTATGANGVVRPSFNGSTVNWTWSAQ